MERDIKIEKTDDVKSKRDTVEEVGTEVIVNRVKFYLERAEESIEKKYITAVYSTLEGLESYIEEANKNNLDLSGIDNFDYRLKKVKKRIYISEIDACLEYAKKVIDKEDHKSRVSLAEWYYEATDKFRKYGDKIDDEREFNRLGEEIEEIRKILGDEAGELKKEADEEWSKYIADDQARAERNMEDYKKRFNIETGNGPDIAGGEKPIKVKDDFLEKGKKKVEEIKNGAKKIDDALKEAGNVPKVVEVGEENRDIISESKNAEKSLKEGTNKVVIEEYPRSESDIRREKWEKETSDGDKEEEIKKYKNKIEAENLLAEGESIESRIKKLEEETIKFAKERAAAAIKFSADTSKLEGVGQEEAREMIKKLAENAKDNLNVAKLDYFLRTEEDLMSTHKDKEITIENLEEMAGDLENLESFLKEFERMSEGAKEEAQEEVKAFYGLIKKLMKDPKVLGVLIASGVLLGLAALFLATGMPVPEALGITAEQAALGALTVSTLAGTGYLLLSKEQRERAKEVGKIAAGSVIGAGILTLGWLLNKEKWEKFIKGVSKENYPDWYHFFRGLFGLNEEEKSKS